LFNGALALANRESGKVLTILLWQSEDASHWYRHYSAEAADDKVTSVERYEVLYSEIEEAHPWPPRSDLRSGSSSALLLPKFAVCLGRVHERLGHLPVSEQLSLCD
jgi:hypothetical protein